MEHRVAIGAALRITEKPGTVFRWSAPSCAGTGWRGARASVSTSSGACIRAAVTTTSFSSSRSVGGVAAAMPDRVPSVASDSARAIPK